MKDDALAGVLRHPHMLTLVPAPRWQKAASPQCRGHPRAELGGHGEFGTHRTAQPQGARSTSATVCHRYVAEKDASPSPAASSRRRVWWDTSPSRPCCPPAAPARCQDADRALQSTRQAVRALVLHWQSCVPYTCDGILPFTPLCVLPDFALALTLMCSLDPAPALGAPMAAA